MYISERSNDIISKQKQFSYNLVCYFLCMTKKLVFNVNYVCLQYAKKRTVYYGFYTSMCIHFRLIFIALTIPGAALFGLLGSRTSKFGRSPITYLGLFVHMASFYIIFLMLPASSPIQESDDITFIYPR